MTKTEEGFQRYIQEWVIETGNHAGFVKKLGAQRAAELEVRERHW